jgi:hypothetical protein
MEPNRAQDADSLWYGRRGRQRSTSIQNGRGWITQIKALHWQTPARGSFDHQRLFGALANPITLKTPIIRLGMAINGGNGQR